MRSRAVVMSAAHRQRGGGVLADAAGADGVFDAGMHSVRGIEVGGLA
jgi:hypothetical protein